eukprot:15453937-Alexandrium_andersonii.AAC.1
MGEQSQSHSRDLRAQDDTASMLAETAWDIPHSGADGATHGRLHCDLIMQLHGAAYSHKA